MNQFTRVVGICRLWIQEIAAVVTGSWLIAALLTLVGVHLQNNSVTFLSWNTLLFGILAVLFWRAIILDIINPNVSETKYLNVLRIGGWIVPNPVLKVSRYAFASTHPSYFFIDILTIAFAIPLKVSYGYLTLILALIIPVLRLATWYGAKRKPTEVVDLKPWMPVVWLYGICAGMALFAFVVSKIF